MKLENGEKEVVGKGKELLHLWRKLTEMKELLLVLPTYGSVIWSTSESGDRLISSKGGRDVALIDIRKLMKHVDLLSGAVSHLLQKEIKQIEGQLLILEKQEVK
jgi:hypothetical protein